MEMDFEFDDEYVLGLLDYCTRPSLQPNPMTNGYSLTETLHITLRKSDILAGVIGQFLENKGIRYQSSQRNSEGIPERINITSNKDIKKFYDLTSGNLIQIAKKLEYLNKIVRGFEGKNIAADDELFLRIYKPWAQMHSHWKDKKYTLDFFKKEFGIECVDNPIHPPNPEYPESISTEYVAGAFDGNGNISRQISENPEFNIGYGMNFFAQLTISHPDIRVKPHFIQYFQKNGLDPGITDRQDRIEIRFETIDGVEKFVEQIGVATTYLYNICDLLYTQLIPAYRDQYHTTKEGFLDMLRAYEEVAPEQNRRKYTTEYFEQKWDV